MPFRSETKHTAEDTPEAPSPICPQCSSSLVWKDGFRSYVNRQTQRYLCRDCGVRFSEPTSKLRVEDITEERVQGSYIKDQSFFEGKNAPSHNHIIVKQGLNNLYDHIRTRRVGASNNGVINTVATETIGNVVAGETTDNKSMIFNYTWHLQKNGYAPTTIRSRKQILQQLVKSGANLNDPESVKAAITRMKWVPKRKVNAVDAFSGVQRMLGRTWEPPHYKVPENFPFVPTEKEIDAVIAGTGPRTSTLLLFLKETGVRIGEATRVKWFDIDYERKLVSISPEKGSNPRIIPISDTLLARLHQHKRLSQNKDPSRVFSTKIDSLSGIYAQQRKRISVKLQNPRLNKITFHSFRHWHGTVYYMKHGLLETKARLGHKSLTNTMKYVHLGEAYFKNASTSFDCREAKTVEQAKELITKGYDYVTEMDGVKLFRKPDSL